MRWGETSAAGATRRVATCLIFLSLAAPARAGGAYVIFGAGSRPCGSWLQVRSQALPDSAVLQSWVLGYVTSVNANVLVVDRDVASGASQDELFSFIDSYCAAHPLDSIARAAAGLVDSLRSKHVVR